MKMKSAGLIIVVEGVVFFKSKSFLYTEVPREEPPQPLKIVSFSVFCVQKSLRRLFRHDTHMQNC